MSYSGILSSSTSASLQEDVIMFVFASGFKDPIIERMNVSSDFESSGATVPMNVQAVTEDDGEFVANPYCDKVKSGESEATGVCHDRRDNSETTGLYLCNTGVWEEEWKDCEDATEDE